MTEEQAVRLFTSVGFPVAVAAFVLIRLEKRLADILAALNSLAITLAISRRQGPDGR